MASRVKTRPGSRLSLFLLAFWLASAPTPLAAEGLLEFLFGPEPTAQPAPRPRDAPAPRRARVQGDLRFARPREGAGGNAFSSDPSAGGFCVRACDGYYFPLIKSTRATRQQSCELACPSAQMEVFDGATIETARNRKGQRYSALPRAFAFRDKAAGACACNDPQTAQADLERSARNDPTLQSGDVVVETEGAFVYRGTQLVPLSSASFVSPALRDRLRAMLRRRPAMEPSAAATQPAAAPFPDIGGDDRTGSTATRPARP